MNTGKFYVGQTSEVGRRLSHHFGHLRNNAHACYRLQELYNISSECSFMFKYALIDSAENRYSLEEEILKEYKNSELLLNTTIDGETWIHDRNLDRVNAYKKKMSNMGKDRTGSKNAFYGKRHTDECRKRMSDIKTGSTNPNCWKAVVVNGKYYKKLEDASVDIGIPLETVAHRVNNNNYMYCNYYAPEDENDIKIIDDRLLFDPKIKTVRCVYEIEGNIYYKTDDILEDYPEIKRGSIYHRIKSKNPKFKNWKKII